MPPKDVAPAPASFRVGGDDALIEAAWLYYHEDMNQTEIADAMRVSRASVVNYLRAARERGLVKTELAEEAFRDHAMSRALRELLGLKGVYVVPTAADAHRTHDRVCRAAAQLLPGLLAPGDRLGVTWGMTLQALGMHLDPQMIEGLTVLQLVGSMTTHFGYSSDIVSANIARALGADCVNLHAPAQVSSPEVAEVLRAEPVIAAQLVEVSRFNRAVFSAGSCAPGCHVVRSGLATEEDLADYVGRGARAVVFGRFIDGEGNEVDGPLAGRLIGVEPGRLRDAETRLLVSSRPGRGDAVRAALAGGFVTHLVLSRAMAEELAARPV